MENEWIKPNEKAFIFTRNNIVYKVNDQFLHLVGYKDCDLVGKSLKELSQLLKIDSQTHFEDIKEAEDLYIFTNEDLPIDVTITCKNQSEEYEKQYYIKQNNNSTLEMLLLNFGTNGVNSEEAQTVYSYPALISLKSNKKYIDALKVMTLKYDDFIGSYHPYPKYLSKIVESGYFRENE